MVISRIGIPATRVLLKAGLNETAMFRNSKNCCIFSFACMLLTFYSITSLEQNKQYRPYRKGAPGAAIPAMAGPLLHPRGFT